MLEIIEKESISVSDLEPKHFIYAVNQTTKHTYTLTEIDIDHTCKWVWINCVSGVDELTQSTSISNAVIDAKRKGLNLFATLDERTAETFVANNITERLNMSK